MEKKSKLILVGAIIIIVLLAVFPPGSLFPTRVIGPRYWFIDSTGSSTHTTLTLTGDQYIAQSFVLPNDVDYIKYIEIQGLTHVTGSYIILGLSPTLTGDLTKWIKVHTSYGYATEVINGKISHETDWDSVSSYHGTTMYIILKLREPTTDELKIDLCSNTAISDGNVYIGTTSKNYDFKMKIKGEKPVPMPDAVITISPTNPQVNQQVTFDATGSYAYCSPKYAWDLNNDGTYETTGSKVYKTYPSAGSHLVVLRVTDCAGSVDYATKAFTVSTATPPPPDTYTLTVYTTPSDCRVVVGGGCALDSTSGVAVFPNLEQGTYIVTVSKTDYETASQTVQLTSDKSLTFTLQSTLPDTYALTITAVSSDDYVTPIVGASVIAGSNSGTTDTSGIITFQLEPGNYPITITHPTYEDYTTSVTITDSDNNLLAPMKPHGIPGFELLTLVIAIGFAFIILKKRKK